MWFVIAAVPALVVYLVGRLCDSKRAALVTAWIAGLLGLLTGQPAWAGIDVIAVSLAYFVTCAHIERKQERQRKRVEES